MLVSVLIKYCMQKVTLDYYPAAKNKAKYNLNMIVHKPLIMKVHGEIIILINSLVNSGLSVVITFDINSVIIFHCTQSQLKLTYNVAAALVLLIY